MEQKAKTDAQKRAFISRMFALARRYGVEDILPGEIVTAIRRHEAGESAAKIAAGLWGGHSEMKWLGRMAGDME